jgi:hypothetical protein
MQLGTDTASCPRRIESVTYHAVVPGGFWWWISECKQGNFWHVTTHTTFAVLLSDERWLAETSVSLYKLQTERCCDHFALIRPRLVPCSLYQGVYRNVGKLQYSYVHRRWFFCFHSTMKSIWPISPSLLDNAACCYNKVVDPWFKLQKYFRVHDEKLHVHWVRSVNRFKCDRPILYSLHWTTKIRPWNLAMDLFLYMTWKFGCCSTQKQWRQTHHHGALGSITQKTSSPL